MNSTILWTSLAREDYYEILIFLKESYGEKSVVKFYNKIEKELSLIKSFPKIYPKSNFNENIRRIVIVKQVSLYYYIDDLKNEIIILRLYSNKRNPRNLNDEINEPR